MLVEGWLPRAAAGRPDMVAIETPDAQVTYARLHALAAAAAAELGDLGARRGTRVAIVLPAGLDFAVALHACLLIGAVAVPVDLRLGGRERGEVLGAADFAVQEPLVPAAASGAAGVRGGPPRRPVAREPSHDLDAPALVIHTSGTTAAPRPVELTCGNVLWSALGSAVALGLDPRERWLCTLPLSHVGGLSILLRSAIYGTTAVVHERFEADAALAALTEGRATLVSLVATTLARLLDAGLRRPPALRAALTGGGPVPAALVARAEEAGVPVSLTYGMTESCSQATTAPVAARAGLRGPDGGPPLFCTRLRISAQGEILLRGPTVAHAAPAADGWLHTGDLGELDAQGRLRVTGRAAETIVSGGENVAPAEVEAVLEGHPDVREAAVIAREDERWGEAVTAIVVPREGRVPDPEELRARCTAALAPYKVPKRFEISSAPLPRTPSGKLLRRELA